MDPDLSDLVDMYVHTCTSNSFYLLNPITSSLSEAVGFFMIANFFKVSYIYNTDLEKISRVFQEKSTAHSAATLGEADLLKVAFCPPSFI